MALEHPVLHAAVPHAGAAHAEAVLSILPHNALDLERIEELTHIQLYLEQGIDLDAFDLDELCNLAGISTWRVELLGDKDWVAESQKGLPPIQAGRFFLFGSHDTHRRAPFGSHRLLIDAQIAFGTGHHGSTKGCLLMFDRLLKKHRPRSVLDVGTGTGVLAIAAAKALKLTYPADATDIDSASVKIALDNAVINGVDGQVNGWVSDGYRLIPNSYDLIFANILAKPLASMAPEAARHLNPGGYIIMAGLQHWQRAQVINAHRTAGLILVDSLRLGNWTTLLMRRP